MKNGDETAFAEFHARYFDRMFRYAFVLCRGNEESAKDVAQEALVRVVRYVKPMPDEQILWSWLTVLLRSAGADYGRKQTRYHRLRERFQRVFDMRGLVTASADANGDEPGAMLASALSSLDQQDRMLIERKYFQRESYRELAADLNTTERAIEGRLARIRENLKRTILRERHQR